MLGDLLFGFLHGQAVQDARVDHDAGLTVGEGFLLHVAALDHFDDGQIELLGELPVTGIVSRHSHDGAGAVGYQHIVGDKDGDLFASERIDGGNTLELNASLFLGHLGALKVRLPGCLLLVGLDLLHILELIRPLFQVGMLRGDHHVSGAIEGVGTGGVDGQLVAGGGVKIYLGAGGTADPVLLLSLNPFGVIHQIQVIDEPLGVLGDLQHPLALHLMDHFTATPLAHAVDHFLVGQNALTGGAPVHVHFLFIGQALLEQLEEDPLGPLVVLGIGSGDFPAPVEADAQRLDLLFEPSNILLGHLSRMYVVLDGVVLGGQTEGVPADGIQHIVTLHPALSGHHVQGGIRPGMTHVQTLPGGVGELDEGVILGLVRAVLSMEHPGLFPGLLPLRLYGFVIVFHLYQTFPLLS